MIDYFCEGSERRIVFSAEWGQIKYSDNWLEHLGILIWVANLFVLLLHNLGH